jgi:hypothetical protein
MREAIAERLKEAEPALAHRGETAWQAILIPLTDPGENATPERQALWERQCDRCGLDCRTRNFQTGAIKLTTPNGLEVTMTFGLCIACARREQAL